MADLVAFPNRRDPAMPLGAADRLTYRSKAWLGIMHRATDLYPIPRGAMGFHLWRLGQAKAPDRLEFAVSVELLDQRRIGLENHLQGGGAALKALEIALQAHDTPQTRSMAGAAFAHAGPALQQVALNLCNVEGLLAARGIPVSCETIRDWCAREGPVRGADQAGPADKWHLDEMVTPIAGQKHFPWWALIAMSDGARRPRSSVAGKRLPGSARDGSYETQTINRPRKHLGKTVFAAGAGAGRLDQLVRGRLSDIPGKRFSAGRPPLWVVPPIRLVFLPWYPLVIGWHTAP